MIGDIFQPTHLLFILVVALLVLGPKRLPEAGRALGRGIRDFRMAMGGEDHEHPAVPSDTSTVTPPVAEAPAPPAPTFSDTVPTTAASTTAPAPEATSPVGEPATQTTEPAQPVG